MKYLDEEIESFLGDLAERIARMKHKRFQQLVGITVVVTCLLPCQP